MYDRATLNSHTGGSQVQFDIFLLQLFCFGVFRTRSRSNIETSWKRWCRTWVRKHETFNATSSTIALYFSFSFIKLRRVKINKQIIHILWIIKKRAPLLRTYQCSSVVFIDTNDLLISLRVVFMRFIKRFP